MVISNSITEVTLILQLEVHFVANAVSNSKVLMLFNHNHEGGPGQTKVKEQCTWFCGVYWSTAVRFFLPQKVDSYGLEFCGLES